MKIFNITPIGKPRMTRSDRWKKRKCVLAYWEFKRQIQEQCGDFNLDSGVCHVKFYIPMPKSWSKQKKAMMKFQPHQQKPDVDNLLKAFFDALCDEDSHIWRVEADKFWSDTGRIDAYN